MFYTLHNVKSREKTPAVFLDRDGTINIEKNYLYRYEDWEWIDGAKEAIKSFNEAGYLVIVISNQAGIARGMYYPDDVNKLHRFVQDDLSKIGAKIDGFFYCPHHPDWSGHCGCRKPSPLMLTIASRKLNVDMKKSWMVGDKFIDFQAANNAGIRGALVKTGYGMIDVKNSEQFLYEDIHHFMIELLFTDKVRT